MGFLLLATRIACSDERNFVFRIIRVGTRSNGVVRELLMPPGKRRDRVPTWLGLSIIAPACVA